MIELCQNAPAPKIVVFQEVAGTGTRKFGPAEKSPQVVGHFDCARREHGFTMPLHHAVAIRTLEHLPAYCIDSAVEYPRDLVFPADRSERRN
jgi:hypothetical protein